MTNKYLEKVALNRYEEYLKQKSPDNLKHWSNPERIREVRRFTKGPSEGPLTILGRIDEHRKREPLMDEGVRKSVSGKTQIPDSYLGHRRKDYMLEGRENQLRPLRNKEQRIKIENLRRSGGKGRADLEAFDQSLKNTWQLNDENLYNESLKSRMRMHEKFEERLQSQKHFKDYAEDVNHMHEQIDGRHSERMAKNLTNLKRIGAVSAIGAGIGAGVYLYNKNKKDKVPQ